MEIQGQDFGIEIEMTGITRSRAAEVIAEYLGTTKEYEGTYYDVYYARDGEGRKWKLMSDASIDCQRKEGRRKVSADRSYSVELVSPICQYKDIETVQEMIRKLRGAGAFVNSSCGIHIHINAAPFEAPKLRNLVNIMAAKEDMIYKALKVSRGRETSYCQKIDPIFLEKINRKKPATLEKLKSIWYNGGKLYIAYGSNLNLPQMAKRCPTAKVVGTSEIKDYALVFRGSGHGAVATIEPCVGSFVPVLLWKIRPDDEKALDIYEGFPRFYEKETMELILDEKTIPAMVYIMTSGHRLGYPSDYYYNTILEGYKSAGFDPAVLEQAIDYTEQLMESEPELEQQNLFGFGGLKWW